MAVGTMIKADRRPTARYYPGLGLLRTVTVNGQPWYEAQSVRKILWYGDDAPLPALKTEIMIEDPDGVELYYDSSALRALVVASPAPAGLATIFMERVGNERHTT